MLNGIDPIIIFSFFKNITPEDKAKFASLPIAGFVNKFALPPIPIYLSEQLTGIYISDEQKNIDIETNTDTLNSALTPNISQKAINSIVKVNMLAEKDSVGLMILSAIADLILPQVTARQYSITYLHGGTTIFDGLLHSFSIDTESNTTLIKVSMEIIHTSKKTALVTVEKDPTSVQLNNLGSSPAGGQAGTSSSVAPPLKPPSPPVGGLP